MRITRLYGIISLIVLFTFSNVFLCGFVTGKNSFTTQKPYFCIYYEDKKLEVTDRILCGDWYNYDSQKKYVRNNSLYDRAEKTKKSGVKAIKEDFPEIWSLVQKIKSETEVKPYGGDIFFTPDPPREDLRFSVAGQKSGRALDDDKFCRDILESLKNKACENIIASVRQIQPLDEEKILSKIGIRGSYTTYFDYSPSRQHNIALALESFNGLVVQNGETVSFNKIVGARTGARGYKEAKIILDGEFVEGIGGGVCQASTTLFNAVLLSGLSADKSHNHSIAISYVPIGRDAMVSSAADLRFTNNTGGTAYIEAGISAATATEKGSAYVRIYGNKTNIKYKPRTEVTEQPLKADEIDAARESKTYIEAWNGGKLVNSKFVRKSRYKARKLPKQEPVQDLSQKPQDLQPKPVNKKPEQGGTEYNQTLT